MVESKSLVPSKQKAGQVVRNLVPARVITRKIFAIINRNISAAPILPMVLFLKDLT